MHRSARRGLTFARRPFSGAWRRGAVAAGLLLVCGTAVARNALRAPGAPSQVDRAAAAAAEKAASQARAAAAAQQQVDSPLRRALDSIRVYQAAQAAARAAASAETQGIVDGLRTDRKDGGLAPGTIWINADQAVETVVGDRTQVTIVQQDKKSILTWERFDVGLKTDLYFDQRKGGADARSWAVLNRVLDPSARPSRILGSIKAEGQVYVINRNGILFGGASQVNVGTLVASTLELPGVNPELANPYEAADALFTQGLFSGASASAAFQRTSLDPATAEIIVEGGAGIAVGGYGQAVLIGTRGVENRGSIVAPDGQVLLAAGQLVTLTRSSDQRFLATTRSQSADGKVENTGLVSTPRGNITLVAGEVVQGGLLTATTGAEANGSITLGLDLAGRDPASGAETRTSTSFTAGSVTQILPDEGGKKVVGDGVYKASEVSVFGTDIAFWGGSNVYVPAGSVTVGPGAGTLTEQTVAENNVRIYLDAGAVIDVSGLRDVEVAMEQNTIKAELRAAELADNPVLRDSPIRGATVYYDARRGVSAPTDESNPGIAKLSGYRDLVERDVAQKMTAGGKVTLDGNEIVTRQGSRIDLSGGSVRYLDGYVKSTRLVDSTGRRVRVEDAVAGEAYQGIEGQWTRTHGRWSVTETYRSGLNRAHARFEEGYTQGSDAGTLTVRTSSGLTEIRTTDPKAPLATPTGAYRVLEGEIRAELVVGEHQRGSPGAAGAAWLERPKGATLNFEQAGFVEIAEVTRSQLDGFVPGGALDPALAYQHRLNAAWFHASQADGDGPVFGTVVIKSGYTDDGGGPGATGNRKNLAPGGSLTIGAGVAVDLGDGGSFSFTGKQVDLDGVIRAAGGKVSLSALQSRYEGEEQLPPLEHPSGIRVGAGGEIDVAGRFTNEVLADGPRRALNGGSVALEANRLALEEGSLVDVSSGARLEAGGTKVTGGSAGSISLDVSRSLSSGPADGTLTMAGRLAGYGVKAGGSLAVRTSEAVEIASAPTGAAGVFALSPEFFQRGGFTKYTIQSERSVTVKSGTTLAPSAELLSLPERPTEIPGGVRYSDIAGHALPPQHQSLAMNLELAAKDSDALAVHSAHSVKVEEGASISLAPGSSATSPGSSVSLSSTGELLVNGAIEAPGGAISLEVNEVRDGPSTLIRIGAGARLTAAGYTWARPEGASERRGITAGGTITIRAGTESGRSRTAPDVLIEEGAVLDVHGVRGLVSLAGPSRQADGAASPYQPVLTDGDAGSISIQSVYGGQVAGTLHLDPGGLAAAGGKLEIAAKLGPVVLGDGSASQANALAVDTAAIRGSGADDLGISANRVLFDGPVSLQTRRSLTLASQEIGVTTATADGSEVVLDAGRVALVGSTQATPVAVLAGTTARSTLTVNADLIDVSNVVQLGCADGTCGGLSAKLHGRASPGDGRATGDIRFTAAATGVVAGQAGSGLFSAGSIELEGSQVYVTSRSRGGSMNRADLDPGFLVSADTVTIRSNGEPAPVPLSFGERLTVRARIIDQGGVLRAPAGQVRLEASEKLTLRPGSLTSSSLEGRTALYGDVELLGFDGYRTPGSAPEKSVTLKGPDVDVQDGAVVDVSGGRASQGGGARGGDLVGYSFLEGNGGTRDVLADADAFAVLPSIGQGFAPLDQEAQLRNGSLRYGDSVYLSGVPGLAAGYYTLLPARYALLDGGRLIREVKSAKGVLFASAPATSVRADGTVLAAGKRAVAGTPVEDAGWRQFEVLDQGTIFSYSDIRITSFDTWARERAAEAGVTVRTTIDAGSLVLDASRIAFAGTARFAAPEGRLAGNLDIAAAQIEVVARGTPGREGFLTLDVETLGGLGAGSVLLGGTRATTSTGTSITARATQVTVDTGGTAWVGPEILLAATDQVSIADGSIVRAEGADGGDRSAIALGGDGAFLRLSSGSRVGISRTYGQGAPHGAAGDLSIGAATLSASGSLSLDGAHAIALGSASGAGLSIAAQQIDLSATSVLLGDAPAGLPGTRLDAALVAALGASSDVLLRGHDSIQLFRNVDGTPLAIGGRDDANARTLRGLTLDTSLLLTGSAGEDPVARIDAGELTLLNGGDAAPDGATGSGVVELDVGRLVLGGAGNGIRAGSLRGRADVVEATGAGALDLAGDLSLATARLSAASGILYRITAAGAASLVRDGTAAPTGAVTSLGGRLQLEASTVELDTSVVLPAGTFQARATSGALRLGSGASIDLRGEEREFGSQTRWAPGGIVRLEAAGDLSIAAGAVLDVSGAERGGDAGTIDVVAGGTAALDGDLRGRAAAGFRGGAFSLDAAGFSTAGGFTALNRTLEAGGLDDERSVRLREQGLALAEGETLRAHRVSLRADAGAIGIAGTIDASGGGARAAGGAVEIVAAGDVSISGTIDARAADVALDADGYAPASGEVEIASTGGRVTVAATALVDVSGGRDGGGRVVIRARRSGSDLEVAALGGTFRARQRVLQGLQVYGGTTVVDGALAAQLVSEAAAWQAGSQDAVRGRLGSAAEGWEIAPAMQVEAEGDLAVTGSVDLHALAAPGHLTLRAAGSISFANGAGLSDGFAGEARDAALLASDSFGLRLDAGGDVTLGAGTRIRTGTGDIAVRAGGDLTLADTTSVVYTAGRDEATHDGFDRSGVTGAFPVDGGDVDIAVRGDITAAMPRQSTSAWLFRSGGGAQQTSWSIVPGNFEQGVGALGGGDVWVRAGGDVTQLAISVPTTGHVHGPAALEVRGGGNLALTAGGDIRGGLVMLGRGRGDVRAGGGVLESADAVAIRRSADGATVSPQRIGLLVGLMDSTVHVVAGSSVQIQGAFDPMRQEQIAANRSQSWVAFEGYTDRTALDAAALGGELRWMNDPWASVDPSRGTAYEVRMSGTGANTLNRYLQVAPPTLRLASLESSVKLTQRFTDRATLILAPAASGNLELLAARDLWIGGDVTMEATAGQYRHGPFAALAVTTGGTLDGLEAAAENNNYLRGFDRPLHADDRQPVRLYALSGSVCANIGTGCASSSATPPYARIKLPKPVEVLAGKDLYVGYYFPQNNGASDLSWFRAGRDIDRLALQVRGTGSVVLMAGRDVVMAQDVAGVSKTSGQGGFVFASGNTTTETSTITDPTLAFDRAADVFLLAGAAPGVDYAGFADVYLDPENRRAVAETYLDELKEYMIGLGFDPAQDDAERVAAFQALSEMRRKVFLERIYFEELRTTGIEYNDRESQRFHSYQRGFDAIRRLFPVDPATTAGRAGDVLLNGRPVETRADGDITVLAPYGRVLVGNPTRTIEGGVVTRRGGDIRIMADQDISLETSRVFTLQGGDITMWTSRGSITAGTGSKTSVFQLPLAYVMSNDGVVGIDAFGIATGAGIGVLDALQGAGDRPRSRMDLIAPFGEVNAGDAGIRVTGDLNIAAAVVVGVENIQVSGGATGVPSITPPTLPPMADTGKAIEEQGKKAAEREGGAARPALQDLPSIITVEILGVEVPGDEQGKEEDAATKRRKQAKPAGGAGPSTGK